MRGLEKKKTTSRFFSIELHQSWGPFLIPWCQPWSPQEAEVVSCPTTIAVVAPFFCADLPTCLGVHPNKAGCCVWVSWAFLGRCFHAPSQSTCLCLCPWLRVPLLHLTCDPIIPPGSCGHLKGVGEAMAAARGQDEKEEGEKREVFKAEQVFW